MKGKQKVAKGQILKKLRGGTLIRNSKSGANRLK